MQKKTLLSKQLTKYKIHALLITDLKNVRYMSGFTGSAGFIVYAKGNPIFVTDFRYEEQARHEVRGFKVVIEKGERTNEIKKICDKYEIRRLGFEEQNVTYGFYKKLVKRKFNLKPVSHIIETMRIKKSAEERLYIAQAVRRAERAFRKLRPYIRVGTTEQKLARKLEELLKQEGCKSLPFGVIVASGQMSALPHAQPTGRRLKRGDFVVFDWGGEFNGYFSDMTRTILIKSADIGKKKEIYSVVLEAQIRAIKKVKSGVRSSEVDAAARNYIKHYGFDEYFGHGTGHGVGLAVHEKPVVSWRSKEILENNMVFTIEPGIYIPELGGVRIEDMVMVQNGKAELLTSLPKKLDIIKG